MTIKNVPDYLDFYQTNLIWLDENDNELDEGPKGITYRYSNDMLRLNTDANKVIFDFDTTVEGAKAGAYKFKIEIYTNNHYGGVPFYTDIATLVIGSADYSVSVENNQIVPVKTGKFEVPVFTGFNNEVVEGTLEYQYKGPEGDASPEGFVIKVNKEELGWEEALTITYKLEEGYTETKDFVIKVNGEEVEFTKGKYKIAKVTEDIVITVEGVADITAPTGTVTVNTSKWESFLNKVTFGKFYKESQKVTIEGKDLGSGVAKVEYYVSNKALAEKEVTSITSWTTYEKAFKLDPSKEYVVYAKITDAAGHITYVSSDGIVVENIVPVVLDMKDGDIFCATVTFGVTDDYLDTVKVDGVEVKPVDGKYTIEADNKEHTVVATDKAGNSTTVKVTVNEKHTEVVDEGFAPTCTLNGVKDGAHCKVCGTITVEYAVDPALGHEWSTHEDNWVVTKEATATTEGKKESYCLRDCGQKKVVVIPKVGEVDNIGNLEKDAEVEPTAPITEATLNNAKEELVETGNIFTKEEKEKIENGEDARVWLEISKTDESAIADEDKSKMEEKAAEIMGDNLNITYFDADLFKQVGTAAKQEITEPGVAIKISILIPEELLNHDKAMVREYKIIRLHEGAVDVISGEFNAETGEFSFETDKFSTYAIVYGDTPVEEEVTVEKSPATGDTSATSYAYIMIMLCGLSVMFLLNKKNVLSKKTK